jgi:osmotically-inducible protein OsmY
MYTHFRKLILTPFIALSMVAISSAVTADTVSQEINEARQEIQIWTTYALSPYLRAYNLNVSVQNGKATLTGKVDGDVNKDLAKQIALGVNGVKEVDNQIVVETDYVTPARSSERSYGEVIDDATITAAVKSKLLWSKHANGLAIDVDTNRGKVKLTGTADSGAAKELAGLLAMNTHGVVSVNNQLVIDGSKLTVADNTRGSLDKAGQNMADSWITTKVKSTFMYSSNVNSSDISVSTDSGIVTLSGKVNSGAERALAVELAQNVRGVKSVDSKSLTL